jgi:hypothetical protein
MAEICVKNAHVSSGINPALDGFCGRRVPMTQTHVDQWRPGPRCLWKSKIRLFNWDDLTRKLHRDSTSIDQSLGTLITTGSGSPLFSALETTSWYVFPYATRRFSSEENAAHPLGGASRSALMRASGLILFTCIQFARRVGGKAIVRTLMSNKSTVKSFLFK